MKYNIEVNLKAGDIHNSQISKEAIEWLKEYGEITYRDDRLNEDLYNLNSTLDNESGNLEFCHESILDELHDIKTTLDKNDCSYLRITY